MKEITIVTEMEITTIVSGDHGRAYSKEDLRELGKKLTKESGADNIQIRSVKTFIHD